jgi:hypothetical protein
MSSQKKSIVEVGNLLGVKQHGSSASLSILNEPQKYFDEHEHIDDV